MRNKYAKVCDPNNFVSDPGSKVHVVYEPKVLPNGEILLSEVGKEDIQDYINSFRDQTDMAYILKQLAKGDTSVLSNAVPSYGDFTNAPSSFADALQMVMDAESKFNKLPLDVRNKFDNDFRKWFATSGNDDWFEKMDSVIVKPDAEIHPIDDPIKKDEVDK